MAPCSSIFNCHALFLTDIQTSIHPCTSSIHRWTVHLWSFIYLWTSFVRLWTSIHALEFLHSLSDVIVLWATSIFFLDLFHLWISVIHLWPYSGWTATDWEPQKWPSAPVTISSVLRTFVALICGSLDRVKLSSSSFAVTRHTNIWTHFAQKNRGRKS